MVNLRNLIIRLFVNAENSAIFETVFNFVTRTNYTHFTSLFFIFYSYRPTVQTSKKFKRFMKYIYLPKPFKQHGSHLGSVRKSQVTGHARYGVFLFT